MLDRDGNGESCLDIAHRLGRKRIAQFLKQNYPQLEGKVGFGEGVHTWRQNLLLGYNPCPFISDRVKLTGTLN